jgi:hypothetical protein
LPVGASIGGLTFCQAVAPDKRPRLMATAKKERSTRGMMFSLWMHVNLGNGESGVNAQLGGMKRKYDILARHARRNKFFCDGAGRAIVLDPDFSAADIDVHNRAMHAAHAVPTDMDHFIMIAVAVDDRFGLDLPVRRFVPGVFFNQAANDLAVSF